MNPAAAKANAAVTRPVEQVLSEESANVGQGAGVTGRMEAMAAVIDVQAGQLEAAGQAADARVPLQYGDAATLPAGKLVGGAHPSRSRSQNDHFRRRHTFPRLARQAAGFMPAV